MKRLIILSILISAFIEIRCQSSTGPAVNDKSFLVVSYNCENLFDTINDPMKDDDDFTPTGKNQWNTAKYQKKLDNLSKVISSLHNSNYPSIVGLVEVENKMVCEDLFNKTGLKKYSYGIVHHESPDNRGIDVAIAYRKDKFKVIREYAIPINFPDDSIKKIGRNIQFVEGVAMDCDTLYIFLNHWKSRIGGEEQTEKLRMFEAQILKNTIDSLYFVHKLPRIVAMGDFNDEPDNKSISEVLKATGSDKRYAKIELFNLMAKMKNEGKGTHAYEKKWNMLDQIIINKGFLSQKKGKLYTTVNSAGIIRFDWMMYKDKDGNMWPNATFGGKKYFGGYSDHFPVYLLIEKSE